MTGPLSAPPLSLYVHLPWCVQKCPYCDFNSFRAPAGELPEQAYCEALLADLERDLPLAAGRRVETIFFGGGTPSLFRPETFAALLASLRARLDVLPEAEVSLEANPGTIEHGRFAAYREAGINRVSLGAQTFAAAQLKVLGRIHEASDTLRAIDELKAARLGNFNLDLMYALPEQTEALAAADLDAALGAGAPHLSYYHLTLEVGTAFHRSPPPLPEEEVTVAIERQAERRLAAAGFVRYEISAWAQPGHECRHNLNYWRYGDYLGLGAGAHGKLSVADEGRIVRTEKPKNPATYLSQARGAQPLGTRLDVAAQARPFEFMLNATRLTAGFRAEDFEARTGLGFESVAATVAELEARGLLERGAGLIRPSPLGLRFLNDVQAAFLES